MLTKFDIVALMMMIRMLGEVPRYWTLDIDYGFIKYMKRRGKANPRLGPTGGWIK